MNIEIRHATYDDGPAVAALHRHAFPAEEAEHIAEVALELLAERADPPTFNLVALADGVPVGHVAFSPVEIATTPPRTGYLLAPLAVSPACQRAGLGARLVHRGIDAVRGAGAHALFVYGDPAYYGRFGFDAEAAQPYLTPYPLQYPFGWQARVLDGRAAPPSPVPIRVCTALRDPGLW